MAGWAWAAWVEPDCESGGVICGSCGVVGGALLAAFLSKAWAIWYRIRCHKMQAKVYYGIGVHPPLPPQKVDRSPAANDADPER
jgi:hypothetical protein